MTLRKSIAFILIACFIYACDAPVSETTNDKETRLKVFAVNYPLLYFAERIGGDYIDLIYPIPKAVDPAYWDGRESIGEIQKADLILDNGAGYAKWIEKVSLSSSKIVNTCSGIDNMLIPLKTEASHSHGGTGEHVHTGYAFTTWLNFKIASHQAEQVLKGLITHLPSHKIELEKAYQALKKDLLLLDSKMTTLGEQLKNENIFVSHPVYQYLGKAYELTLYAEHWEPSQAINRVQWKTFKKKLESASSTLMLWEGPPSKEQVVKLQDVNMKSVLFNPCSNTPENGDFLKVMNDNLANLEGYINSKTLDR